MTLAEATSLVAMPVLFLIWGVTWGLPRSVLRDEKSTVSRWVEPRLVVGVVSLVVAMNLGIVDVLGSLALRAVVLVVIPFVVGFVLGRRIGAHEQRTRDGAPEGP